MRPSHISAIEGTVTVIATICFLPCICLIGGGIIAKDLFLKARKYERPKTRRRRESKERKKAIIRSTPKRVAPRLERHLTIGRPEPEADEEYGDLEVGLDLEEKRKEAEAGKLRRVMTVTDRQEESAIFKLPLEIRRKVYEDLLGGYVIHIYFVEAYRRMSHTRCKNRSPEVCRGMPCRQIFKVKGASDAWGNVGLLPLLQSCRRIYSEAIEILYKNNTFDFDSLDDVLKLSLTLLPERMCLIKTVQWKPTVSTLNHLSNTPWLNCRSPRACCCITCWPKAIGLDEALVSSWQYSIFLRPLPKSGWQILERYRP